MLNLLLMAVVFSAKGVVISEVMANPKGLSGAHMPEDRNEFVELYNAGREAIDLYNYRIGDGDAVDFICAWQDSTILEKNPNVIINNTWLKPGGYAVILDPEYTDPDAQGGFVQPYRFGDSCLILTVGNTTIGNGLANNDPVIVFSIYGDSSTFGTPGDAGDSFPYSAGDGFSWERIELSGPDIKENWAVCPEGSGSTPGRQNGILTVIDVVLAGLFVIDSVVPEPGNLFNFGVNLKNSSFIPSPAGEIRCWFGEADTFLRTGLPEIGAQRETTLIFSGVVPRMEKELWVKVIVPLDKDTMNNRARVVIVPGGQKGVLSLGFSSFTPDDDGFEDSLPIFYSLPEPRGRLTIRVFDLKGRVVRTLVENLNYGDFCKGTVYWNGRRDNGALAPSGFYCIVLDCRYKGDRIRAKMPVVLVKR
ncbi:MAG: lamin tail domain-containing protein [candidate division WOR-3 bacterium]